MSLRKSEIARAGREGGTDRRDAVLRTGSAAASAAATDSRAMDRPVEAGVLLAAAALLAERSAARFAAGRLPGLRDSLGRCSVGRSVHSRTMPPLAGAAL